jgi:F-type H+-transporting ATPase subunit b
MDINLTLIGQMISFGLFVWFTMKFVWPSLEKTLNDRQFKISEGLQAAERGHKELEIAQKKAAEDLREARAKAHQIIESAQHQAGLILEEAKNESNKERLRIIHAGKEEIQILRSKAAQELQGEVVNLVINTTEKLLDRTLTEHDKKHLMELKNLKLKEGTK